MIVNFRGQDTRRIFEGERSLRLPARVLRSALRKLYMLDAAVILQDLRVPPGNHLEKLSGEFAGFHSIRINDQWRICFRWKNGNAHDVEILDYHS